MNESPNKVIQFLRSKMDEIDKGILDLDHKRKELLKEKKEFLDSISKLTGKQPSQSANEDKSLHDKVYDALSSIQRWLRYEQAANAIVEAKQGNNVKQIAVRISKDITKILKPKDIVDRRINNKRYLGLREWVNEDGTYSDEFEPDEGATSSS